MSDPPLPNPVCVPAPSSALAVLRWLQLLNSPETNHEPDEFVIEKARLKTFRQRFPEFSIAAALWPDYAAVYWDSLKPQILQLFTTPNSFNFVQWVLEYAREKYPSKFKLNDRSIDAIIELTDGLCNGSISPLHMAAVLGIPNLSQELISQGADVQKASVLGSPLYCALVGPLALVFKTEPSVWIEVFLNNPTSDRVSIISLLLDAGADCGFRYKLTGTTHVPQSNWHIKLNPRANEDVRVGEPLLTALAFRVASLSNNFDIFDRMVRAGAGIDNNLLTLLKYAKSLLSPASEPLFVMLIDFTIEAAHHIPDFSNFEEMIFYDAIQRAMRALNMDTENFTTYGKMKYVADNDYPVMVRSAITGRQGLSLRRLASDPRFDPNIPASPTESGEESEGTIAHLAVSGDHFEAVDILIRAGADFTLTDGKGRTPLMVAESVGMLDFLVNKYRLLTTNVDNDGRTIWHYAAATNDGPFMNWLCNYDPSKERNIEAKTKSYRTPLQEALHYVTTLQTKSPADIYNQHPAALLRLLEEMKRCSIQAPPAIDTHQVVAWGMVEIVDGLTAIGADLNTIDSDGNTIFHHLNFAAKLSLVRRLREICPDLPVSNKKGITAAETIFNRTSETFKLEGFSKPKAGFSAHPACEVRLDVDAFLELLTPQTIGVRDANNRGLWERFTAMASETLTFRPYMTDNVASRFLSCMSMALQCLIHCKAMKDYEDQKQETALLCLTVKGLDDGNIWDVENNQALKYVILYSQRELFLKFCETPSAHELLFEAWEAKEHSVIQALASAGLRLHIPTPVFDDCSFIELILGSEDFDFLTCLRQLLDSMEPGPFLDQHSAIYNSLVLPGSLLFRSEKFDILLQKGLDPNFNPSPPVTNYCLPTVIRHKDYNTASTLLKYGADPGLGNNGFNALIASSFTANMTFMAKLIEVISERFPNFNWDSEWKTRGTTYNALRIAAASGKDRLLLLLLDRTPLKYSINKQCTKHSFTAAHLAASRGHVECLYILHSRNADLTILDSTGQTPLKLAVSLSKLDVISFLLRIGAPDAVSCYHHAVTTENTSVVEVFEKHGFKV